MKLHKNIPKLLLFYYSTFNLILKVVTCNITVQYDLKDCDCLVIAFLIWIKFSRLIFFFIKYNNNINRNSLLSWVSY